MKRLSPKSLKVATTLFLVLGFVLLFAGPTVMHRGSRQTRRAFAQRVAVYLGGLIVSMSGAGVGAILLVRQAREEYRESALRNMQELMEASRLASLEKSGAGKPAKSLFDLDPQSQPSDESQDDA